VTFETDKFDYKKEARMLVRSHEKLRDYMHADNGESANRVLGALACEKGDIIQKRMPRQPGKSLEDIEFDRAEAIRMADFDAQFWVLVNL
jgi:hypothetical protein